MFETVEVDGSKQYRPFDSCLSAVIPGANAGTVPLTNQCPFFVGGSDSDLHTTLVDNELPAGAKIPKEPGIYFLSGAIDAMAYGLGMSKDQILEVIERIEASFLAHGLKVDGPSVGRS